VLTSLKHAFERLLKVAKLWILWSISVICHLYVAFCHRLY
jgi:hypothetical protein